MIKRRNMHRLFDAFMILLLAIPVLAYSGCTDDYSTSDNVIGVRGGGWGVTKTTEETGGCGGITKTTEETTVENGGCGGCGGGGGGGGGCFWFEVANDELTSPPEDGQQSQPPATRQVEELPPLEISPDELPTGIIELGPGGGGGDGGGVRGGAGGGRGGGGFRP